MSCYFRHLGDLFAEAGVEVTKANRKALSAHISRTVGDETEHCPTTWQLVKEWRADPARRARLAEAISEFARTSGRP